MRIKSILAVAVLLASTAAHAAPKPAPKRTVARPSLITPATQNRYEADVRSFSEWMQKLQGAEAVFGQSIEKMWATFDAHNKLAEKASEKELADLFAKLIKDLGDIKQRVGAANEQLLAIKPITGNMAATELPPGFLAQLISDARKSGTQTLELIDRGQTHATAMSLGETALGEEFSELMADGSGAMVSSALSRARSTMAIAPKGSSNSTKVQLMVSVYEAMDHLFKESRKLNRKETAYIDVVPAKAAMARAVVASKAGLAQTKKEQAQALQSAAALGPDLLKVIKTQKAVSDEWFTYMAGRAAFYAAMPDRVGADEAERKQVDSFFDGLAADEAKYTTLHQQLLAAMAR
jgi:hypothetical protein